MATFVKYYGIKYNGKHHILDKKKRVKAFAGLPKARKEIKRLKKVLPEITFTAVRTTSPESRRWVERSKKGKRYLARYNKN